MNTALTLTNFWKDTYAKEAIRVLPEFAYNLKSIKFGSPEADLGGDYVVPIISSREHGFTYSKPNAGPVTGIGPKTGSHAKAKVQGFQFFGQGALDYEAASRASKGKSSFLVATEFLYENLNESAAFRQELTLLYGRKGLGAVETATTASATFKVSPATWNAPTWGGAIGAPVIITSSDLTAVRAGSEGLTIQSVDIDPGSANVRTVTLSGNVTLTAGDIVHFQTAVSNTAVVNEAMGMAAILSTTTGTLFDVAVASNPYWKPMQYAVGGQLSITHILKAALMTVQRGNRDDLELQISPAAFQALINPMTDPLHASGSRKLDASYSNVLEAGIDKLTLRGQGFKIFVVPHMLVRDGDGFMCSKKRLKRVGTQELSFVTPGKEEEGEIFVHNPNTFSYEVRCYSNQALFIEKPGQCVYLSGITA